MQVVVAWYSSNPELRYLPLLKGFGRIDCAGLDTPDMTTSEESK